MLAWGSCCWALLEERPASAPAVPSSKLAELQPIPPCSCSAMGRRQVRSGRVARRYRLRLLPATAIPVDGCCCSRLLGRDARAHRRTPAAGGPAGTDLAAACSIFSPAGAWRLQAGAGAENALAPDHRPTSSRPRAARPGRSRGLATGLPAVSACVVLCWPWPRLCSWWQWAPVWPQVAARPGSWRQGRACRVWA